MSQTYTENVKCSKCGKNFEVNVYSNVKAHNDPEIRHSLLIDNNYFDFKCPHCGQIETIYIPFIYHDDDHKFFVECGTLSKVMENYNKVVSKVDENSPLYGNTFTAITDVRDLNERIIALENDLDYRLIVIYKTLVKNQLNEKFKNKKQSLIGHISLHYNKEMGIDFLCLDSEGNQDGTYPFKKDKYDVIYNRYNDKVKEAFTYIFDEVNANKLINMNADNIEDLKHDYSYIAVVSLENGEDVFAKLLPKNMNDFKSNDKVLVVNSSGFIFKGIISSLLYLNEYQIESMDCDNSIISILKEVPMETTRDSDKDLDNLELFEELKKYLLDYKKLPSTLIFNSEAILGLQTMLSPKLQQLLDDPNCDIEEIFKTGEEMPRESIIIGIETRVVPSPSNITDLKVMAVYLSKSEIPEGVNGLTVRLNDIFEMALFRTDCDGILINPDSDYIFIPTPIIYDKYLHERYMTNVENMCELLKMFDEDDKKYIDEFSYKIISMVYFELKGPSKIAEELNVDEQVVHNHLTYGYKKMIELLKSKYILRKR